MNKPPTVIRFKNERFNISSILHIRGWIMIRYTDGTAVQIWGADYDMLFESFKKRIEEEEEKARKTS